MKGPFPVSAEIASRLLEADLANIVRKLKRGAPLTPAERSRLSEAKKPEGKVEATFARTLRELAEILGVTRRTLQDWRKIDGAPKPEANGSHDVAAWRRFQREAGKKGADEIEGEAAGDDLPGEGILKRRKLFLHCQEREMLLEYRRGELIEAGLVRAVWKEKSAEAESALSSLLTMELAERLESLDGADIHGELSRVVDDFVKAMRGGSN